MPWRKSKSTDLTEEEEVSGLWSLNSKPSAEAGLVDIVAIHGLGGHYKRTWTHENGQSWLENYLPNQIPNARVLSFGYNSVVAFSKSVADIGLFALQLLNSVNNERETEQEKARPLIFVAHSLGGIIVKRALITAHERSSIYGPLLQRIYGIAFMGTPHRGSSVAYWTSYLANILRIAQLGTATNSQLLTDLQNNSRPLADISQRFVERGANLNILTFFELEPYHGILFVDKESACLNLPNEILIPLERNHKTMCKFSNGDSKAYGYVWKELKRMVGNATEGPSTTQPTPLEDSELQCLRCFSVEDYDDTSARLPDPAPGTCEWIFEDPRYVTWENELRSGLLWVSGHAGCGKSVLSSFLIHKLEESARHSLTPLNICYFFCNDKTNVNMVLCVILHQLMSKNRSIRRHVQAEFEKIGPRIIKETAALWEIFKSVRRDSHVGDIICVLDALDEFPDPGRSQLIDKLISYQSKWPDSDRPWFKIFVTSRPYKTIENDIYSNRNVRLRLEDELETLDADIFRVIDTRLSKLQSIIGAPKATIDRIRSKLIAGSEHTFLWVTIVLDLLEHSSKMSQHAIEKYISDFPSALDKMYEKILVDQSDPEKTKRLLCIIMAACRPLTLEEINIALHIRDTDRSEDDIRSEMEIGEGAMERMIRSLCGPLIRISRSTVSLIHFTVKEYISHSESAAQTSDTEMPTSKFYIDFRVSHYVLAEICVWYLLFDEFLKDPLLEIDSGAYWKSMSRRKEYKEKYKFFSYASSYWTSHVYAAKIEKDESFLDLIWRLCDSKSPRFKTLKHGYELSEEKVFEFQIFHEASNHDGIKWSLGIPKNLQHALIGPLLHRKATLDIESGVSGKLALHAAVYQTSKSRVEKLLDDGHSIEERDGHGATPLHAAALVNNEDILLFLLQKGACIDACDDNQETPLHIALALNRLVAAQLLLAQGADAKMADSDGCTPMHLLAEIPETLPGNTFSGDGDNDGSNRDTETSLVVNSRSLLSILLSSRVDINAKDRVGQTPLHFALTNGLFTISMELISSGADVEAQSHTGYTPLMCVSSNMSVSLDDVAERGKGRGRGRGKESKSTMEVFPNFNNHETETIVVQLLRRGAKIEAMDEDMWTALHYAAIWGNVAIIGSLLNYGANIEARNNSEQTPLHLSTYRRHDKIMEILLNRGANIEAGNNKGRTPLHISVNRGQDKIIEILLNRGANIEAGDNKERTPLHLSVNRGHDKIIDILLNRGANIEAGDNKGRTSLHFAASKGHDKVIDLLLNRGANIEAKDNDEWTSLHFAVSNGHDKTIELLLNRGANIEARDKDGMTSLHFAAYFGHETSTHLLIDQKANINARENSGFTALHGALVNGKEATTRILLKTGENITISDLIDHGAMRAAAIGGHESILQMLVDEKYIDAKTKAEIWKDAEDDRRQEEQMQETAQELDTEQTPDIIEPAFEPEEDLEAAHEEPSEVATRKKRSKTGWLKVRWRKATRSLSPSRFEEVE